MEQQKPYRGWKLFYGNGTTFSSNDGSWDKAPKKDVQILMVYEINSDSRDRPTRRVYSGCDFYFKDGDNFGQSNDIKLVIGDFKYGGWMNEDTFNKLMSVAMEDYKI